MKTKVLLWSTLLLGMSLTGVNAQIKINSKSVGAATKAVKAVTLSNEDVVAYTKEYVEWMDENNPVAPSEHELAQRLENLVKNLKNHDGLNLNYKVYLVRDVNAFACADGSIRICAGLMEFMNDNEVLGVIGHEIGHVKNEDSKDAFRTALLTSALKDGVTSQGGAGAVLTQSQLGDLGEQIANMSYSRKQEYAADDYAYEFLKRQGINPWYMATAFERLMELSDETSSGKFQKLMSSHPETQSRVDAMIKKAEKDGYERPTE